MLAPWPFGRHDTEHNAPGWAQHTPRFTQRGERIVDKAEGQNEQHRSEAGGRERQLLAACGNDRDTTLRGEAQGPSRRVHAHLNAELGGEAAAADTHFEPWVRRTLKERPHGIELLAEERAPLRRLEPCIILLRLLVEDRCCLSSYPRVSQAFDTLATRTTSPCAAAAANAARSAANSSSSVPSITVDIRPTWQVPPVSRIAVIAASSTGPRC